MTRRVSFVMVGGTHVGLAAPGFVGLVVVPAPVVVLDVVANVVDVVARVEEVAALGPVVAVVGVFAFVVVVEPPGVVVVEPPVVVALLGRTKAPSATTATATATAIRPACHRVPLSSLSAIERPTPPSCPRVSDSGRIILASSSSALGALAARTWIVPPSFEGSSRYAAGVSRPASDRGSLLVGCALAVALLGMAVLPWANVAGDSQRGNGVAEHLLAVPTIKGVDAVGWVRALGFVWYVGIAALLAAVAVLVFAPRRRGWLALLASTTLGCAFLLGFAMHAAALPGIGIGPVTAFLGAGAAVMITWRCPPGRTTAPDA